MSNPENSNPHSDNFYYDEEDLITFQFNSNQIEFYYSHLARFSGVIRNEYHFLDVKHRFSKDLRNFQEKNDINTDNIILFFQFLQNNFDTIQILTYKQYIDLLKISNFLQIKKLSNNLNQYFNDHNSDVDFQLQIILHNTESSYNTENHINEQIEALLSANINECFQNGNFALLPVSLIYRIVEKSDKGVMQNDLLYDFIKENVESFFVLFSFIDVKFLSDQRINELAEHLAEPNGAWFQYAGYLKCNFKFIMELKNDKKRLQMMLNDSENEKEQIIAELDETEEERDNMEKLLNASKKEKNQIKAKLKETEKERDHIEELLDNSEKSRNLLLKQLESINIFLVFPIGMSLTEIFRKKEKGMLPNFHKIYMNNKEKILFDREIDLFPVIKEYQYASDYQFTSAIEKRNKSFDEFRKFLRKPLERSYDPSLLYDKFFFNIGQDFLENQFDDFLFIFFKDVCPRYLSNYKKDNFIETLKGYQQIFHNNPLINQKANYIWSHIGLDEYQHMDKLIPDNFDVFDIEKILVLHNICVLFSFRLNFVYVPCRNKNLPNLFTAGCIYTENSITIALHYDTVADEKKFHLFLLKPQSVSKKSLSLCTKNECLIDEINEIDNMNLFHCVFFKINEKMESQSLCEQILDSKINYRDDGLQLSRYVVKSYFYETSFLDFPIPVFQNEEEKACLFTIYHPKKVEIIDVCLNYTSVYVISKHELNGYDHSELYIQIFEGNVGTQCLDDMYVCAEIVLDQSNYEVFGKISLVKCENSITPTAFIIAKNRQYYTIYAYKKPEPKTFPNDFCKSDYHVHWEMINANQDSDKTTPKTFVFSPNLKKLDFDDSCVIFETDISKFKLDLNDLASTDIERCIEDIESDQEIPKQDPRKLSNQLKISPKYGIIGIEINNQLFLLLDKEKNIYFHPARNNFYLKSVIKSAFYQFKQNVPVFFNENKNFGSIEVIIDAGYYNSKDKNNFNQEFDLNPFIPGIYFLIQNETKKRDFKKLKLIFANADMLVGENTHRTKCQLIAAYALSKKFIVYGRSYKKTIFKPRSECYDNWMNETVQDIFSNLIATYGVLLQMRDDNELTFAMRALKTTKYIMNDFDLFYQEFLKYI